MRIGANGGVASYQAGTVSIKSEAGARYAQAAGSAKPGGSAEDELAAYVKMTPAERMRDALLKKLGVTEEELGKMTPEQRKGVESKMADLVKQELAKAQQAHQSAPRIDTYA